MKRLAFPICALFVIIMVLGATAAPAHEAAEGAVGTIFKVCLPSVAKPPQKGIGYVSWWPGEYSHPDSDLSLANVRATGATWISLLVTWYQDTYSSTTI